MGDEEVMGKGSRQRPTNHERYCAEYERLFGKGGPVAKRDTELKGVPRTRQAGNPKTEKSDNQTKEGE